MVAAGLTEVPGPAQRPSTGAALVTAEQVAARLGEPGVVLLEVDEEPAVHHLGHLPGATYVDWQDSIRDLLAPGADGQRAFEELMSRRGVRPDDEVVLYGDEGNRYAASIFWVMRYHGHARLRLLDGGRTAWLAQGRQLTDAETQRPATRYVARPSRPDVRAGRDEVLGQVRGEATAVLVDCRSADEFAGHALRAPDRPSFRGPALGSLQGHLPGAVHLPAARLLGDDDRLLAPADLARVTAAVGLSPDRPVLAYCHRSERSCLTWFALTEVLGYVDVRVYDGGWQEYGNLADAVVERAPDVALR